MWRTVQRVAHQKLRSGVAQRAFAAEPAYAKEDTLSEVLSEVLRQAKVAGTLKHELKITTPQAASVGAS